MVLREFKTGEFYVQRADIKEQYGITVKGVLFQATDTARLKVVSMFPCFARVTRAACEELYSDSIAVERSIKYTMEAVARYAELPEHGGFLVHPEHFIPASEGSYDATAESVGRAL